MSQNTPPEDGFPQGRATDMRDMLLSPPTGARPGSAPGQPWQPPTAEELQALLPQYEILRLLGRGGMGAVYQGRQISLDRVVAIKILSNDLENADAGFAERFKNEARAMAKLSHPGIVAVHDFGETPNGLLFIVMEYVEGTDVQKMIASNKRLHTEHAMAITAHVCDALHYAHERGIIHRDIKPANIMVSYDGVVKVADFGLAKISAGGETAGLTQSGMAMGTLHYMAPEALMLGTATDKRADIYAVGVMLYHMLTGKLPQGMFELPSIQVAGLDPRYDGIIARALREDRDLRYPTAADMRADLDGILTRPVVKAEPEAPAAVLLPPQARPQRPGGQAYRPQAHAVMPPAKSRSSWPVLVWLVVIAVIGTAAWLMWFQPNKGYEAEAAAMPAVITATGTPPPAPSSKTATGPKAAPPQSVALSAPRSSGLQPLPSIPSDKWVDAMPAIWADAEMSKRLAREADGKTARVLDPSGWRHPLFPPGISMKDQALRVTVRGAEWGADIRRKKSAETGDTLSYGVQLRQKGPGLDLGLTNFGKSYTGIAMYPWPQGFDWKISHTIECRAVGKVIFVALDGQKMGEISDDRITAGYPLMFAEKDAVIERFEYADLDPPVAAAEPSKPKTITVRELAELDQQFSKLQAERVTAVFEADVTKLNTGYVGGLDREMAKERAAGRLDSVLALEEEKKLVMAKQPIPATGDASINTAVKNLRAIYRDAHAKLETTHAANLKALTDPLALRLKTLEADLTKQNRIADAKVVREYREKLPAQESVAAYSATNPFTNSLGMKFVPVPGTGVLFCTHITRRGDYAAYAADVPGVDISWKTHPKDNNGAAIAQGDDYPVVGVNWNDAKAFCNWLTAKEGHTYRMPTDREWSYAAGIGRQEEGQKNDTPENLSGKIKDVYPWGTQWPPPNGAGNFADTSHVAMFPTWTDNGKTVKIKAIPGYTDGYPLTSPVFAFKPNMFGIHDLTGNIGQWCEDWFDKDKTKRLARGMAYNANQREGFGSSWRSGFKPTDRLYWDIGFSGFRCVVVASSLKGVNAAASKTAPPVSPTTIPPASVSTPQAQPGSASATAIPPSAATTKGLRPIKTTYQNKAGVKEDRFAWKGKHVAVLSVSDNLDPGVMAGLVDTLDNVYEFHQEATGREPRKTPVFQELAITAEDDTSKSGMSTGVDYSVMWMKTANFRNFYTGVAERGEYSLGWFREFGLNTWYYTSKLTPSGPAPIDAFPSGYCVLMRTLSTERLGIKLDPMKGGGQDWRKGIEEMLKLYLEDQSLSFNNTVAIGQAPVNPAGLGSPELFASFCLHLCKENGGDAYNTKLWHEVAKSSDAKTPQDGIDNFILAACAAADKDLSDLFASQWRWPMSPQAVAKANKRWKKP